MTAPVRGSMDIEDVVSSLLRNDLCLRARSRRVESDIDLEDVCTGVLGRAARMPLVYTAFDGDHQMMCGHMRSFVLRNGGVPANPESILGYKDTVDHRITKRGVLLDDLAILRGCDELWIFTDVECDRHAVAHLAEGVAIELLFYLRRKSRPCVKFVSTEGLLRGEWPEPVDYTLTYEETKSGLLPDQREGVLDLANSRGRIDKSLPALVYHIADPLDYKYTQWLRAGAYGASRAPLIPYLAVELQDLPSDSKSMSTLVHAWVRLCDLASRVQVLPTLDAARSFSLVAGLLEKAWLRKKDRASMEVRDWQEYAIPKVRMGNKWPITRFEGGEK